MTWAITCSLASSHGMSFPLHQIDSLALMAIEALLVLVAEWVTGQRLPGHFAMEFSGYRGLSLTGDYNRAGAALVGRHLSFWPRSRGKRRNLLQFVPRKSQFTPACCSWLDLTPCMANSCGQQSSKSRVIDCGCEIDFVRPIRKLL